jgi:membrane protein DedA with SNARE-associated domain
MEHFLATWGYLALFAATLISSLGIPIGSEVAIGFAGALASGQVVSGSDHHHLNLIVVIVVATLGEIVGSCAGYAIGKFGGRPLVDRWGKYVLLTHRDLDRAEAWFDGRGESVVLFARFIPLVRSFISLAAGLAEMAFTKFLWLSAIGCLIWCAALASIGYSLGSSWHHVIKAFSYAGYIAIVLVIVGLVVVIGHRVRTLREENGPARHVGGSASATSAVIPPDSSALAPPEEGHTKK